MTFPWIDEALKHNGLAEIPGKNHNPTILKWLRNLKAWWAEDETPWCGTFVAHCLRTAGFPIPKHWYRARAYLDIGIPLLIPRYGCLVIFNRKGGGHVAFVLGVDTRGRLMCIGGNQGNKVSIIPFDRDRVLGYRWPGFRSEIPSYALAVLDASRIPSSESEA